MKKVFRIIFVCIAFMIAIQTIYYTARAKEGDKLTHSVSSKLIRFHVLANSDSEQDQALKLKVKDAILNMMSPKLEGSKSIEESRKIIIENDNNIRQLAEKVIRENGYNYTVKTELAEEVFPEKTYGNITLPSGDYEAYRVLIGNSEGKNWWCVMFPPLCFVDVTKGEIAEKETDERIKSVLSEEEYDYICDDEEEDIQIKSKLLDLMEEILK